VATALQLAAAHALSAAHAMPTPSRCFASGPFALIFAMLALFVTGVPVTARFSLGVGPARLPLTDKAFTYAAAAQLALGGGRASLVPALAGAAAGAAVAANVWGLATARVRCVLRVVCVLLAGCVLTRAFCACVCAQLPRAVVALCARALTGSAAGGTGAAGGGVVVGAGARRRGGAQPQAAAAAAAAAGGDAPQQQPPPPPPQQPAAAAARAGRDVAVAAGGGGGEPPGFAAAASPEALDALAQMGFDRAAAAAALQHAHGDVALAAELLLESF
jgi:hypothetical protein